MTTFVAVLPPSTTVFILPIFIRPLNSPDILKSLHQNAHIGLSRGSQTAQSAVFVAARLRSTDLPEDVDDKVEPEPFLSGHPILLEDMDIVDVPRDKLYELNQRLLEESMVSERPLISPPVAMTVLREEYFNSSAYLAEIDNLINQGYKTVIRARGDGDCFYRALAFAYLDRLIRSPGQNKEAQLAPTKDLLANAGFDDSVYEQPYEILQQLVQSCRPSRANVNEELLLCFMDPLHSNYIVMYMRLLTSAELRVHANEYADFLFDYDFQHSPKDSIDDFCKRLVEPLGTETDSAQVKALGQALRVPIKIAYMDGHSKDGRVDFHIFPIKDTSSDPEPIILLYRPGHYDLIQKDG